MSPSRAVLVVLLACAIGVACGDSEPDPEFSPPRVIGRPTTPDGGATDGGATDGGLTDGGVTDGGVTDGGLPDAAVP